MYGRQRETKKNWNLLQNYIKDYLQSFQHKLGKMTKVDLRSLYTNSLIKLISVSSLVCTKHIRNSKINEESFMFAIGLYNIISRKYCIKSFK